MNKLKEIRLILDKWKKFEINDAQAICFVDLALNDKHYKPIQNNDDVFGVVKNFHMPMPIGQN